MLIAIIRTLSFLKPGADDDTIDRLNYYYTATFLMILALLVSYKVFGGRPLVRKFYSFIQLFSTAQLDFTLSGMLVTARIQRILGTLLR